MTDESDRLGEIERRPIACSSELFKDVAWLVGEVRRLQEALHFCATPQNSTRDCLDIARAALSPPPSPTQAEEMKK